MASAAAPIVATEAAKPEPSSANAAAASPTPVASAKPPAVAIHDPSHAVVSQVRTTVVIQGDNLWDLARKYYNDGTRYSDIYAANQGQIRDPSLIYIGQVFVVPQANPHKP